MAADAEGNLWAGTTRSGLLCLQPRRVRTLAEGDGLPDAKTWALLEAADGSGPFHEALNNAIRHARARQVTLRFEVDQAQLVLAISDDGQGFDPHVGGGVMAGPDCGLGLGSMRERLALLGGVCEIRSQPGQGTEVTFRVPLPRGQGD